VAHDGARVKLHSPATVVVRVRWIDHKCKVNSDEFDEEESYLQVRQVSYTPLVMVREASAGFSEIPPKATGQGTPIRASAPYSSGVAAYSFSIRTCSASFILK
jgi:hypothetical protein